MKGLPEISAAEWDVMKVVWDHGPATSGEIVKHLEAERKWRPRTIKTLLARLVKKGAVLSREDPVGRFLYSAKVQRDAVVRRESRSFVRRVFDGAVAPALVHFLEDAELTPAQIDELKKILKRRESAK